MINSEVDATQPIDPVRLYWFRYSVSRSLILKQYADSICSAAYLIRRLFSCMLSGTRFTAASEACKDISCLAKHVEATSRVLPNAERLYCTLGVHPTRCQEIEDSPEGPEGYWSSLKALLKESLASGKVVAIGECGLDYDRYYSPAPVSIPIELLAPCSEVCNMYRAC